MRGIEEKEPHIQWAFNLGSHSSAQAWCQVCPEDSLHPERPSADSGRQGPFPNAGGSHRQFAPEKLCFGALHAQLASSVLRLPQDWERTKLGGVTSTPWPGAK